MILQNRIRFGWIFLAGALALGASDPSAGPQPGVVVETITHNLEADKAGLKQGDVIQKWTRDGSSGEIKSPFDLSDLEIEQAPRGNVTLEGLRGTEKRVWTLGLDRWGIQARPFLTETVLSKYLQGQELAKSGKQLEAAQQWREAAVEAGDNGPPWLPLWVLSHAGEVMAGARQWKAADDLLVAALEQAERVGPAIKARLLQQRADTYQKQGDFTNAEKYYRESLAEDQKVSRESLSVAASLNLLGALAERHGDLKLSEEYLQQALAIEQKVAPDSLLAAVSMNTLGTAERDGGDLRQANEHYLKALVIRERLAPDSLLVAASLNNLGLVAFDRGDLDEAANYHQRALAIKERLAPNSLSVSASLNNLGLVAENRGDLAQAENYFRRTLDLQEKLNPDSLDAVIILTNLGHLAFDYGDLKKSEEYHLKALAIQERLAPNSPALVVVASNLGLLFQSQGNPEKAEEYYQRALAVREGASSGGLSTALPLTNLGVMAAEKGAKIKAEAYFRQALAVEQKLAPNGLYAALTLNHLGDLLRADGRLKESEERYRQALAIREKLAPGSIIHAESLAALGSLMQQRRQLREAADFFGRAVDALESQTARLRVVQEMRTSYRASHAGYYADYVHVLMDQGNSELAFYIAELSHARSLLAMLGEARVDIRKGVDPGLLERERTIKAALSAKSSRRTQLLAEKHTDVQVAEVEKELAGLRADYAELGGQIRASSPGYAALTQPQPLKTKEVQQLLDGDTVLLEYVLGEDRSYVWAIASDSLISYELPKRATIETLARNLYKLFSTPGSAGAAGLETVAQKEAHAQSLATSLSRMLLGPVASQIRGKRLLIVSDGALQYIPFAALPEPGRRRSVPLVVEHEVVYSPSASVLAMLRRGEKERKIATKAVAVLADPVFNSQDARVQAGRGSQPPNKGTRSVAQADLSSPAEHLSRSTGDLGLTDLARLPFSRREANAILAVTPSGQAMAALDFQASRATATSADLADYRVIHFATHGLLDSLHPELSGLVLSLVDEQGSPQNGFLDLQDIYNLNLSADLVVLSACETALGREIRGEGLIGLTRGFMYAGASRVLASLWKVDDVATSDLMGAFYKAMEQDGMPPAAALRQAQVDMWKQKRWSQPYYWAGFQLQGEWK